MIKQLLHESSRLCSKMNMYKICLELNYKGCSLSSFILLLLLLFIYLFRIWIVLYVTPLLSWCYMGLTWSLILVNFFVSLRYEWNNRRAHCMAGQILQYRPLLWEKSSDFDHFYREMIFVIFWNCGKVSILIYRHFHIFRFCFFRTCRNVSIIDIANCPAM